MMSATLAFNLFLNSTGVLSLTSLRAFMACSRRFLGETIDSVFDWSFDEMLINVDNMALYMAFQDFKMKKWVLLNCVQLRIATTGYPLASARDFSPASK